MNRIEGDISITGRLVPKTLTIPDGSVDDAAVAAGADISADKLCHEHRAVWQQPNTTATAETRVIHVCRAAGTIEAFVAGSIAACTGNATITVDLRKNGSTVLSAVITLDNANTARVVEAGTVTTPDVAAGDVLEIVIAVNAGTGALGTGLFCAATVHEEPA
jgi:hypothetical protein